MEIEMSKVRWWPVDTTQSTRAKNNVSNSRQTRQTTIFLELCRCRVLLIQYLGVNMDSSRSTVFGGFCCFHTCPPTGIARGVEGQHVGGTETMYGGGG